MSYEDTSYPETSVRLPDGNMIVMGKETFMAPEIMFQVILVKIPKLDKMQIFQLFTLKVKSRLEVQIK